MTGTVFAMPKKRGCVSGFTDYSAQAWLEGSRSQQCYIYVMLSLIADGMIWWFGCGGCLTSHQSIRFLMKALYSSSLRYMSNNEGIIQELLCVTRVWFLPQVRCVQVEKISGENCAP